MQNDAPDVLSRSSWLVLEHFTFKRVNLDCVFSVMPVFTVYTAVLHISREIQFEKCQETLAKNPDYGLCTVGASAIRLEACAERGLIEYLNGNGWLNKNNALGEPYAR